MPEPQYISDRLTPVERDIIQAALSAEDFRDTAWDKYGPDWPNHVPSAVNTFVFYYFGCILFPYQLAVYYSPVKDLTLHGGRGSGKTEGTALALATYHALHPGENLIWLSITKDQARRGFDSVVNWGSASGEHPKFMERFVADSVTAPFPELRFHRWAKEDPGTICRYRSLGDENIERLRSLTAATICVDEAFRDVETEYTYSQLRGCLRGVNQFRLNLLSPDERENFQTRMYQLTLITDTKKRAREEASLTHWIKEHGLNIRGLMLLMGNAGPQEWEWQRHDRGRTDPEHFWSVTVCYKDNPYFGEENAKSLERSFGDNKELMEVEMLGRRPRNLGDVFEGRLLNNAIDDTLIPLALEKQSEGVNGYDIGIHTDYDVFRYYVPPVPGHLHVIGSDPGTSIAPGRNKWTICVWDISELPVKMVGFEMGYSHRRQVGDYTGYLQRLSDVMLQYPCAPGDVWVEATGNQKGMVQVAWPEGVNVTPVEFTSSKPMLISFTQQLLGHGLLRWQAIAQLLIEMGNYTLPDKDITQDCVMAVICAAGGIWKYYGRQWEVSEPGDQEPAVTFDRYARPVLRHTGRGLTSRRR